MKEVLGVLRRPPAGWPGGVDRRGETATGAGPNDQGILRHRASLAESLRPAVAECFINLKELLRFRRPRAATTYGPSLWTPRTSPLPAAR